MLIFLCKIKSRAAASRSNITEAVSRPPPSLTSPSLPFLFPFPAYPHHPYPGKLLTIVDLEIIIYHIIIIIIVIVIIIGSCRCHYYLISRLAHKYLNSVPGDVQVCCPRSCFNQLLLNNEKVIIN